MQRIFLMDLIGRWRSDGKNRKERITEEETTNFDEAMQTAKGFDALTCAQQIECVTNMLDDAIEQSDMDLVRATMIPLALIRNRVANLEESPVRIQTEQQRKERSER